MESSIGRDAKNLEPALDKDPWGGFLEALAHQLRNPLGPSRNAAFLLKGRGAQDPELEKLRGIIERQTEQLSGLVATLLDVSRAARSTLSVQREPLELGKVLAASVEAWRPRMEALGQRLTLDLAPGPLPLEGDPARLRQVFESLLANACAHTPAGGEIHLATGALGACACVRVRDTGSGMTRATQASLFTLFHGTDGKPPHAGRLGVSLALASRFVQLHGGTLTAFSAGPGKGSEFTVILPQGEVPAPGGGEGAARPQRVLLIEDDENDRMLLEILLQEQGYDVLQAPSGEGGLALALAERPDIAILDCALPGLDGPEVAERIRAELGPAMFLVGLSGFSGEQFIKQGMAAGFDAFLVKGSDPEALLRTLREQRRAPTGPGGGQSDAPMGNG